MSPWTMSIGLAPAGVEFDAIDGQPSKLFFLILAPPQDTGNYYLQALGKIAELVRKDAVCNGLMEVADIYLVNKADLPGLDGLDEGVRREGGQRVGEAQRGSEERLVVTGFEKIDGRKLSFAIEARDGVDTISKGSHDRFIIDAGKFNAGVAKKKASI